VIFAGRRAEDNPCCRRDDARNGARPAFVRVLRELAIAAGRFRTDKTPAPVAENAEKRRSAATEDWPNLAYARALIREWAAAQRERRIMTLQFDSIPRVVEAVSVPDEVPRRRTRGAFIALIALLSGAVTSAAQAQIVTWGTPVLNSAFEGQAFVHVSAGGLHTLALRADGTIAAWGDNTGNSPDPTSGQCQDVPALPPGLAYVAIAAGGRHTLALRSDGAVVACGHNILHQCNVPVLPAGLVCVEIAAGEVHSVARRSDGSVIVWGDDHMHEHAVPPLPPGLTYVEIAAGGSHSLARRSDGSVVAWGDNGRGQCNVPVLPPHLAYVAIEAGTYHSVALRSDGSIDAWGGNNHGQCDVPPLPPGVFYVEVSAGDVHTLARRSDGAVIAWGDNSHGQCGVPALPTGVAYVEISGGGSHSVARKSDGSLATWGSAFNIPAPPLGQTYVELTSGYAARVSDGTIVTWGGLSPAPPLPPGLVYVEISSHAGHVLARRSDGSVVSWGLNNFGQCNVPSLPSGLTYVGIAAGSYHSLARWSDGSIVAWGDNGYGACNVPALPPGVSYTVIAAGSRNSVACRSDGEAVAWGAGGDQYGVNAVLPLPPGLAYVGVATSGYHTLALRSDGSVVGWGENSNNLCIAPPLPPGLTYVEVAAAHLGPIPPTFALSIARRSDGSVVAWGPDYPYGLNDVPDLPAGYLYVQIAALPAIGFALAERITPPNGPDVTAVAPALIDALIPGRENTIAISGAGFAGATAVLLDGAPIDPARYAILSDTTISLDMPMVTSLGSHDLAVTDGAITSSHPVTVVAPMTPKYELAGGSTFTPIDADDGLTLVLSGSVGSLQRVYFSRSGVPSVNASVSLDMGDQFTDLIPAGAYAVPASGWRRVHLSSNVLPAPAATGTIFYSQMVNTSSPVPFGVSNLQSIWMLP
jgi:alpha-tubulin suppressor-like RCC1 family protein